ncbi:MAG TPA: DUF2934 domain-containing protein [Steroidobacteraceae bacterium]|nr:DUF2934 domain-containing protein [Steroidobacteraceae bacterium]
MANPTAKPPGFKAPKPRRLSTSLTPSASTPGSKPNARSKPNSLIGSSLAAVTSGQRRAMIGEAAYYIAERRGFDQGRDVEDWLLAEREIDAALSA